MHPFDDPRNSATGIYQRAKLRYETAIFNHNRADLYHPVTTSRRQTVGLDIDTNITSGFHCHPTLNIITKKNVTSHCHPPLRKGGRGGFVSAEQASIRNQRPWRIVNIQVNPFIPACAGNSVAIFRSPCAVAGSSPRVRGTVMCSSVHSRLAPSVHPRVCGEQLCFRMSHLRQSPVHPRVCGEQTLIPIYVHCIHRFIPACAGNRMCRGRYRGGCWRFIPACAGNRHHGRSNRPARPVHPRVCGEQAAGRGNASCRAGSSPRVRGTVTTDDQRRSHARFIPACAGNRIDRRWLMLDSLRFIPACAGNRCVHARHEREFGRFIPACAGNSAPR